MYIEDSIEAGPVSETTTVYFLSEDNEYEGSGNLLNDKVKEVSWYTTEKPPVINNNESVVFNRHKKKWEVVEDFRGGIAYKENGQPFMITELGDVDSSLSLKSPRLNSSTSSVSERLFSEK